MFMNYRVKKIAKTKFIHMKNSYCFRYNLDDFLIVFEDFLKTVLQFLKALIQPISIILKIKQREKAYFPKKLS